MHPPMTQAPDAAGQIQSHSAKNQLTYPKGQATVLIVDDAPENLSLLHNMLEQAGYTVLVATDGQTALERVAKFTPDAILLDALMPGLSGFETCKLLKTNPLTQYIPVIFMTGLTESEYVINGFEAGGVDYVTKPIKPSEVLARLATHINNSRLASQNRQAIDAAKVAILAITSDGLLRWQTDAATRMMANFDWTKNWQVGEPPATLLAWIKNNESSPLTLEGQDQNLTLSKLGSIGHGTELILLKQANSSAHNIKPEVIQLVCGLTQRESEVMLWVTLGKTNRDIGEILELSPRTVNKHLEHVFVKLGVETRTAAVSIVAAKIRQHEEVGK
jgi:CheY-like chemotaxis protein/DNA-binding CsgD family transcriptional regulator